MKIPVSVRVNGIDTENEVEPRLLLVHYIRDLLGLTGTNVGCDTSQCGSCTILVDGDAVKSCTVLAVQADGSDVVTIEGLSDGVELHPIQQAFWDNHGLQCGFCTPGMIMTATEILKNNPNLSESDVRHSLEGNLCRCTGYENIVKSIVAAQSVQTAKPSAGEVKNKGGD